MGISKTWPTCWQHPLDTMQAVPSGIALPQPLPAGVPTEEEFVTAYAAARGIPPPPLPSLAFHLALSMFRVAAILAGDVLLYLQTLSKR